MRNSYRVHRLMLSKISYCHIDSSYRQQSITHTYGTPFYLPTNPIGLVKNNNKAKIFVPNHTLTNKDQIILQNMKGAKVVLKNAVSIKRNSQFARINHYNYPFTENHSSSYMPAFLVENLTPDMNEIEIIADVVNYYTHCSNTYITYTIDHSLRLNAINAPIYPLYTRQMDVYHRVTDAYLVLLNEPLAINYQQHKNQLTQIEYHTLPAPLIGLNEQLSTICDVVQNYIWVPINDRPLYTANVGGNEVCLKQILESVSGYPNPAHYVYHLDTHYKNVLSVQLIQSIFPCPHQTITDANNKLYWKNVNENIPYELTIPNGNYTAATLASSIEQQFATVNKRSTNKPHCVTCKICSQTSKVTFTHFEKQLFSNLHYRTLKTYPTNLRFKHAAIVDRDLPIYVLFIDQPVYCQSTFINNQTFIAQITDIAIVCFFHHPVNNQLINMGINTDTLLTDFYYDSYTNTLTKPRHCLKTNDLIVTDVFSNFPNRSISCYRVKTIVSENQCVIEYYPSILMDENITYYFLVNHQTEIKEISPIIDDCYLATDYLTIVYQPNHSLTAGIQIYVSNAWSEKIACTVLKIMTANSYQITPLNQSLLDSQWITIQYPVCFQLLFDKANTPFRLLQFDPVPTTITHYLSNIPTAPLKMYPYDYFYLCCPQLGVIDQINGIKNVFTLIHLNDYGKESVFNSFQPLIKTFNQLTTLPSHLHFTMYYPDNTLVCFGNLNHSFTLQITSLAD